MDVKKVAHEMFVPFTRVGASEACNVSSDPREIFRKKFFLAKFFNWNIMSIFILHFIYLHFLLNNCILKCKTYKKICMGHLTYRHQDFIDKLQTGVLWTLGFSYYFKIIETFSIRKKNYKFYSSSMSPETIFRFVVLHNHENRVILRWFKSFTWCMKHCVYNHYVEDP